MTAPSPASTVNEGSAFKLTLSHKDVNGTPTAPSLLRWRVDNLTKRAQVATWATVATPAIENDITVTASMNTLTTPGNQLLEVVVEATIGGFLGIDRYVYEVAELSGIA